VLIGLHTCGDLTPSMLRVFGDAGAWQPGVPGGAAWSRPAAIVNVGCCYHLLTEAAAAPPAAGDGFPLSAKVCRGSPRNPRRFLTLSDHTSIRAYVPNPPQVARLGLRLGGARMLACQAVERWAATGEAEGAGVAGQRQFTFQKHFYRGVLQCVLAEHYAGFTEEGERASRGRGGRSWDQAVNASPRESRP
jgi:hypothetical protein